MMIPHHVLVLKVTTTTDLVLIVKNVYPDVKIVQTIQVIVKHVKELLERATHPNVPVNQIILMITQIKIVNNVLINA